MNFYSFHIGDYSSHTKHLTPLEDICYRRLLDLYYMAEEAIPSDIDKVARLISMRDHSDIVSDILSEFFTKLPDGSWMNERASNEIERYHDKATRARKANQSRWGNPTEKECEMDMKSEDDQIPTITNTKTNNHKPDKKKVANAPVPIPNELCTPDFVKAWATYHEYRRTSRMKALQSSSQIMILKMMTEWGSEAAVQAINTTIRNGWQGVFDPRKSNTSTARKSLPSEFDHAF